MDREQQVKDWYIRYHSILGKRYTKKQKDWFLESLSADIQAMRSDLQLDAFRLHEKDKQEYRNLYVGDLEKADKIICTYYDTPAAHFGSYQFFNAERRKKGTLNFILLSSVLFILMGLLFTLAVGIPVLEANDALSLSGILLILFYGVYFYYLNRITRGWPSRHTLMRNTSSLLLLLDCINTLKGKRVAYAFLDGGTTNQAGLKQLLKTSKAPVYMLDSIGSSQPCHQIMVNPALASEDGGIERVLTSDFNSDRLVYLISGRKENGSFFLTQEDLREKELNSANMNGIYALLEQVVGRNG